MAVVLVPGFMLDADLWSDILDDLEPFGPVIHVDTSHAPSIEDMAAATLQKAPERFDLIGFSMGGYVARAIYRLAQERVRRLVLIATSARGDTEIQAKRKAAVAAADPAAFRGLSRDAIRKSLAADRETDEQIIDRIRDMSLRLGGETFRRQTLFHRTTETDSLSAIRCPTLVIAGSKDRLRSLEEARELATAIPLARLDIIDTGHMIPLESPKELSAALTAFLGT